MSPCSFNEFSWAVTWWVSWGMCSTGNINVPPTSFNAPGRPVIFALLKLSGICSTQTTRLMIFPFSPMKLWCHRLLMNLPMPQRNQYWKPGAQFMSQFLSYLRLLMLICKWASILLSTCHLISEWAFILTKDSLFSTFQTGLYKENIP